MAQPSVPIVYGKYQLLELVGRGGMAEVFKAKARGVEGFEKIVVIKRILPELANNRRFVELFVQEAKLAVLLSHANIVQVFDLGREAETYFIAMEHIAGYDLARVLRRCARLGRTMGPAMAAHVAAEVAKGLDYAHRRRDVHGRPLGIVHRDVSPHNVLLSFEGEVKLTDFGIAKARTLVEPQQEAASIKGKYAYMAPEQARGEPVDARADVFSLGVVLYELLAGVNPFRAASDYETLQRVRVGRAPDLGEVASEVPAELAAIVSRAMASKPAARFETAGAMYEELVHFLFASGERVGGRTLSSFLETLQSVEEQHDARRREERLRVALRPLEEGGAEGRTPVEVPASARSRTGSAPRRHLRTASGTPSIEQCDVSVLALRVPAEEPWPEQALRSVVRRFGGVVVHHHMDRSEEGQTRDWCVLFGARQRDGRDAERAAACGVRVLRALRRADPAGRSFVQAALHEGRVLLDANGELVRDARFDRLLEQAERAAVQAPYGALLATPRMERLLSGRFELHPHTDDPAAGCVVAGERLAAPALEPLVGRTEALKRLGAVVSTAAEGRACIALVEGEGGMGKSRLLTEVAARLAGRRQDVGVTWIDLGEHVRGAPLAAVHELLRALLGVGERTPQERLRQRVERLRELGLTGAELDVVRTMVGLQAGEPLPVDGVVRRLRGVVGRLLAGLARDRLQVLFVDGGERCDRPSLDLLVEAVRDLRAAPIAILVAALSDVSDDVAAWRAHAETIVTLEPLGEADLGELVRCRLGADRVAGSVVQEVRAFSRGNPRMAVEFVEALRAAGVIRVDGGTVRFDPVRGDVEVPRTLRGVVEVRLRGLGPEDRFLLRACAFTEEAISASLLADVLDRSEASVEAALDRFESLGFLVGRGLREYALSHELLGRVLREAVPPEERRGLHAAFAEALRRGGEGRPECDERLAFHLFEAGDRRTAVRHLERAAHRLLAEYAYEAAATLFERAIRWSAQDDASVLLRLFRGLGELCLRMRDAERGVEALQRALRLCEREGAQQEAARFELLAGRLLLVSNRVEEARRWLARAEERARRGGFGPVLREVQFARAEAFTRVGEWGRAIAPLVEVLRLAGEEGDDREVFRCLLPLSQSYAGSGRRREAEEALRRSEALLGRLEEPLTRCEFHKNAGLVSLLLGDVEGMLRASERALRIARDHGFAYEEAVNAHNLGETYVLMGRTRRGFPLLRRSYELCQERGYERLRHLNLRVLGFLDAWRFGRGEGERLVEQALRYAEEHGYTWDAIQACHMLALLDLAARRPESAVRRFERVMRDSEEYGNNHYAEEAAAALRELRAGRVPSVESLLGASGSVSSAPPPRSASDPP